MPKIKQLPWKEPFKNDSYFKFIEATCGNYHYEIVQDDDEPTLRVYSELFHPNEFVGEQERIDDGDIKKHELEKAKALAQAHFEKTISEYFDEEQ